MVRNQTLWPQITFLRPLTPQWLREQRPICDAERTTNRTGRLRQRSNYHSKHAWWTVITALVAICDCWAGAAGTTMIYGGTTRQGSEKKRKRRKVWWMMTKIIQFNTYKDSLNTWTWSNFRTKKCLYENGSHSAHSVTMCAERKLALNVIMILTFDWRSLGQSSALRLFGLCGQKADKGFC